jgi:hypothetical protein
MFPLARELRPELAGYSLGGMGPWLPTDGVARFLKR